ncbi:MAG: hypothetical protein M5U28_40080 [Sandaracinaceae bacterium]|nr:hypothetical protein [Sandaracinaceae bacterium]
MKPVESEMGAEGGIWPGCMPGGIWPGGIWPGGIWPGGIWPGTIPGGICGCASGRRLGCPGTASRDRRWAARSWASAGRRPSARAAAADLLSGNGERRILGEFFLVLAGGEHERESGDHGDSVHGCSVGRASYQHEPRAGRSVVSLAEGRYDAPTMLRPALLLAVVWASSCSGGSDAIHPEYTAADGRARAARGSSGAEAPAEAIPVGRLPEGVTPLAYDLWMEVVPSQERFTGRASIRVRLDAPRRLVWLHGLGLNVTEGRGAPGRRRAGRRDVAPGERRRSRLAALRRADRPRRGRALHHLRRGVRPAAQGPLPRRHRRRVLRVHAVRGDERAARVPLLRRAALQDAPSI